MSTKSAAALRRVAERRGYDFLVASKPTIVIPSEIYISQVKVLMTTSEARVRCVCAPRDGHHAQLVESIRGSVSDLIGQASEFIFFSANEEITDENGIRVDSAFELMTQVLDVDNPELVEGAVVEFLELLELGYQHQNFDAPKSEKVEGAQIATFAKRYERSISARQNAIRLHGLACVVCSMSFETVYGPIGKDFIHIHHLERLADTGAVMTNPATDLVPVCPNCHAMLHKTTPPMAPASLRRLLEEAGTPHA